MGGHQASHCSGNFTEYRLECLYHSVGSCGLFCECLEVPYCHSNHPAASGHDLMVVRKEYDLSFEL